MTTLLSLLCDVSFAAPARLESGRGIRLANDTVSVTFSTETGQVLTLADPSAGGRRYVGNNHDLYCVDGNVHRECDDVADSTAETRHGRAFACMNPGLPGVTIHKSYSLDGEVLTKKVRMASEADTMLLLRLDSRVDMPADTRAGGSYYQPMDAGYEVNTYIFRPAAEVTSDYAVRHLDAGLMAFYQPATDRTLAQYRARQDGKVFGNYWSAADGAWTNEGWQVSLGAAFLGGGKPPVEFESRLALFRGDPRTMHRSILEEPEYRAWAQVHPPEWLAHVQVDGMEALFRDYRPASASWWVRKMLPLELPYVNEGQCMVFILQDWSNVGYYPYEGEVRYRVRGDDWPYEGVTTPAAVREAIAALHALSPKVKCALYTNPACIAVTYPGQWRGDITEAHPHWVMYDRDGTPRKGLPASYLADIGNREYRGVLLDQYAAMVDYYGADMLYLDYGGLDAISFGPTDQDADNHVTTQADCVEFLHELAALARGRGVPLWANGVYTPSLVSDLGIFELSATGWPASDKDWRPFAGAAALAKLYGETRPRARVEVMYPGHVAYYNMVGGYGLLPMAPNQTRGFSQVTGRMVYERIGNALRGTQATTVRVRPDWWRLETKELEAAVLRQGDATIVPVVWHGAEPVTRQVSVETSGMALHKGRYLFAWSTHVVAPIYRNVFRTPGWAETCVTINGFRCIADILDSLRFRMRLEPDQLSHTVLTQVPGFVHSVNGQREYLPLPDNCLVRVTGSVATDAAGYRAVVESPVENAEVLLYVPPACAGPTVTVDGRDMECRVLQKDGSRLALVTLTRGRHEVALSPGALPTATEPVPLGDPTVNAWKVVTDFFPTMSGTAAHEVYRKDGHNCLEVRGASGSCMLTTYALHGMPRLNPDGIEFWLYGRGGPDTISVAVGDDQWRHRIEAGFVGWRQSRLTRDDFAPTGTWDDVERVTFSYTNAGPVEEGPEGIVFADIRFVPPAGVGDAPPRGYQSGGNTQFKTWEYMY